MKQEDNGNITMTIERQLESYKNSIHSTKRHEIMWHAWKHNKQWLGQLLEWVMNSFPNYSRHDESHALSILHNIEMILGEEQIKNLSASDCFLILHVAYIHDIGMCITYDEKRSLMKNKKFIGFLMDISEYGDPIMKSHANILLSWCKEMPEVKSREELLNVKLDIYYAISYLVSEYKRKEHGEKSREILDEWIADPNKLGAGFSTSGMPSRFFYTIGACACLHTSYDFGQVMKLRKVDGGFAHDYMHPRFVAVLLQLGDALDLDNDRFHPLMKEFMGGIPESSELHLKKHNAIRRLRISPDKITIEADCKDPDTVRLVNDECESIKNILQHATFNWAAICPDELSACLPNLEPVILLLNGKKIGEELVNVKFEIQQKKAFNILQGSNIYKNDKLVFLREIFQNAVDASKMQYWQDWRGSRWYNKEGNDIARKLSPLSYPIEVELHLAARENIFAEPKWLDKKEQVQKLNKDEKLEYGVVVRMIDHGIGMTTKDVQAIANVGTSHEQHKDIIENMLPWLVPTAEFGIGLQSVFLVANSFTAYTHLRTNEKYKIVFNATGYKGSGYINVTPLDKTSKPRMYGTIVEVFVPCSEDLFNRESVHFWKGVDPFSETYEDEKDIREARGLSVKMACYVDSLIGEKLFPVKLRWYDYEAKDNLSVFTSILKNKINRADCQILLNGKKHLVRRHEIEAKEENIENELEYEKKLVTWSYGLKDRENNIYGSTEEGYQYCFNCEEMKLYLWDSKNNVYARFGADRLQAMRKSIKSSEVDEKDTETKIFYKGVFVQGRKWNGDATLLEYIDIKGKLDRKYLLINRGEFTEEGYRYIEQTIYQQVLLAAHRALEDLAVTEIETEIATEIATEIETEIETEITIKKETEIQFESKIVIKVDKILNMLWLLMLNESDKKKQSSDEIQRKVLSVIGLASFAQICNGSDHLAPVFEDLTEVQAAIKWSDVLDHIGKVISELQKGANPPAWTRSTFFNLQVEKIEVGDSCSHGKIESCTQNIAEIMHRNNKYAVISSRSSKTATWEERLIWLNPNESIDNNELDKEKSQLEIKQNITLLKNQWDKEQRKKTINKIEAWGKLLREQYNTLVAQEVTRPQYARAISQHMISNWLLENIPTIALFSDTEGNIRINLLDFQYTDSMYFDVNTKWIIYNRMLEIYRQTQIERFSMIAPTGYCQLAIEDNIEGVRFVKRGKFSQIGQRQLIMPLCGKALEEMFEECRAKSVTCKDSEMYKVFAMFHDYKRYIQDIVKKCKETNGEDSTKKDDLEQTIIDRIGAQFKSDSPNLLCELMDEFWILINAIYEEECVSDRNDCRIEESHLSIKLCSDILLYVLTHNEKAAEYEEQNKGIKQWIIDNIIPRYRKVQRECAEAKSEEWEKFLNQQHEASGLKQTSDKNKLMKYKAMKKMVEHINKRSWVRLPEEKYYALYKYFLEDMVWEFQQRFINELNVEMRSVYFPNIDDSNTKK